MNFPRFWARRSHTAKDQRGRDVTFSCWGWSHRSQMEADRLADENARRVTGTFILNPSRKPQRYAYGDRPLREEILREFNGASGEPTAVITRNAYGCQVLNTARAMFVDIDLPELESSTPRFLRKLFGKPSPEQLVERTISKVADWTKRQSGWSWRIYQTRAGVRLLATHALFDPVQATTNGIFEALGADPLYRKLCGNQKSFRARLTPKPWRIDMHQSPTAWPWLTARQQEQFKQWEQQYIFKADKFATCKFLTDVGEKQVHPEIAGIVQVHDEISRVGSTLPLA